MRFLRTIQPNEQQFEATLCNQTARDDSNEMQNDRRFEWLAIRISSIRTFEYNQMNSNVFSTSRRRLKCYNQLSYDLWGDDMTKSKFWSRWGLKISPESHTVVSTVAVLSGGLGILNSIPVRTRISPNNRCSWFWIAVLGTISTILNSF